jgi:hypothetical protein
MFETILLIAPQQYLIALQKGKSRPWLWFSSIAGDTNFIGKTMG